jgi:hypothetical protein
MQSRLGEEVRRGTEAVRSLEVRAAALQEELSVRTKAADAAVRALDASRADLQSLRAAKTAAEEGLAIRIREIEGQLLQETSRLAEAAREADKERDLRKKAELMAAALQEQVATLSEQLPKKELPLEEVRLYVKLGADGDVFGPATFAELYEWASQCRIGPDHLISQDRIEWLPAREVPDLDMQWEVRLIDGTAYGPINQSAIRYLLEDKVVAQDSPVKNVVSGALSTVSRLLDRSPK